MLTHLNTTRLSLQPLSLNDATFIFVLTNSKEWLQFIDNRNIMNLEDARHYIQKIMDNTHIQYCYQVYTKYGENYRILIFNKKDIFRFRKGIWGQ